MAVTTERAASFTDTETRSDEMNSTIETWVDNLVDLVDEAAASADVGQVAQQYTIQAFFPALV